MASEGGMRLKENACDGGIVCPIQAGVSTTYTGVLEVLQSPSVNKRFFGLPRIMYMLYSQQSFS